MPSVVALVQARMGSSRFPGKVLADLCGRPMLERVVDRVAAASSVSKVVVATSTGSADDAIEQFCAERGVPCFRGSEADVLDRFYGAALAHGADVVVRITGDCPLMDPAVIDRVVGTFLEGESDYVTNTLRSTYPDGLDVEVFSFSALERAWAEAQGPTDREHVTPYIRTSGKFGISGVDRDAGGPAPQLRWTVDTPEDLEYVRRVYRALGPDRLFTLGEVLALIDRAPELDGDREAIRNEGYYRSIAQEPPLPTAHRLLGTSRELKGRAERLIPTCTQTFSKSPSQFVEGIAPVFVDRAEGCRVWDVDGNEYLDHTMALGPVILGYNYPAVREAVERQLRDGTIFSLPHRLEVEVAEMLVETVPCAEMVRFGKNGSDATSGAVRVARAYTGRDVIACCGYHGWQDWFIGTTTRNRGVPRAVRELTVPFAYDDLDSLERVFRTHPGRVAAVIMEPVGVVEPSPEFLQAALETAHRNGALMIFDEVITGFRLAPGGAQEWFGVVPDLAALGKAMANGMPISAVVGHREVMELFDEVFFSFTFGGEALSLAAARATIAQIRQGEVIPHIWEQGRRLRDGFNVLAQELGMGDVTECVGLAPRTVVTFRPVGNVDDLVLRSLFQQECLRRGVLFTGSHNLSAAHSEADVDHTLRVYRAALEALADALASGVVRERLLGRPVQPIFREA